MEKGDFLERIKAVPIKLFFTIVFYILFRPTDSTGPFDDILEKVLIFILCYGLVSFFGIFFKGGIISGIIMSVIMMVVFVLFNRYFEDGIIKNIVMFVVVFGGFILDAISIIGYIGISRKEKKEEKVAEEEYLQQAMEQAMQQAYRKDQTIPLSENHNADQIALQDIINQYYDKEEQAKELFEEAAEITGEKHLPWNEIQKMGDEHDNLVAVTDSIRERLESGHYEQSDLKHFRDKYSQSYTDLDTIIRKVKIYLNKVRD